MSEGAVTPSPTNWLKWGLIASLALNLAFIGAVAGPRVFGRMHGHDSWRGEKSGEEFGLMGYARTLAPDRRAPIAKLIKADRASQKILREAIRKARDETGDVLSAEPFDPEKLKAAFGRIDEAEARLKAAGRETFLTATQQLTAGERAGLVEWWKQRRPRLFHHRRGPEAKGDDEAEPPPPKD